MMSVELRDGTSARGHADAPSAEAIGDASRREVGESPAARFVRSVRLFLVAAWLGAAVFFSFAVARAAFDVLPTRELAGALVTRTLAVVNVGGFVVALLALATMPVGRRAAGRLARVSEAVSLFVLAALTAVGHWVIAARLREMRAAMRGTIDALAVDDPARVAFGALHGYSVAALGVGMLAALAAFVLIARRRT